MVWTGNVEAAEAFPRALRQGIYGNNRRLARALAEWGGPLEEGQVRELLHRWAFGTPNPAGLEAPEAMPDRRPPWRDVAPRKRVGYIGLSETRRGAWVARLTRELQQMAAEGEATLDRYAARPDTWGGRIASGDTLLHLIPAVAENPPLALAAFRDLDMEALGNLTFLSGCVRDRALDLAGDAPVVLMAGGNASGKSTFSQQVARQGFPGAVLDAPWVAERDVRRVLGRGHEAWVVFVDRPFEDAFLSMVLRAAEEGRMVAPGEMARTHAEVPPLLLRDLALFRNQPRVSCWHLCNVAPEQGGPTAIGGPLHREGKEALNTIRLRKEHRGRAAFERAAREAWRDFRRALAIGLHNPYPADLEGEIQRGMG